MLYTKILARVLQGFSKTWCGGRPVPRSAPGRALDVTRASAHDRGPGSRVWSPSVALRSTVIRASSATFAVNNVRPVVSATVKASPSNVTVSRRSSTAATLAPPTRRAWANRAPYISSSSSFTVLPRRPFRCGAARSERPPRRSGPSGRRGRRRSGVEPRSRRSRAFPPGPGITEIVDPHRDLPHVGATDQTGSPPGGAITEGNHRVLVVASTRDSWRGQRDQARAHGPLVPPGSWCRVHHLAV